MRFCGSHRATCAPRSFPTGYNQAVVTSRAHSPLRHGYVALCQPITNNNRLVYTHPAYVVIMTSGRKWGGMVSNLGIRWERGGASFLSRPWICSWEEGSSNGVEKKFRGGNSFLLVTRNYSGFRIKWSCDQFYYLFQAVWHTVTLTVKTSLDQTAMFRQTSK